MKIEKRQKYIMFFKYIGIMYKYWEIDYNFVIFIIFIIVYYCFLEILLNIYFQYDWIILNK